MWDGRAENLEAQLLMPLESAEMSIDWIKSLDRLRGEPAFNGVFSACVDHDQERKTVLSSLSAYVRSLSDKQNRFDRFIYGHDVGALSQQEQYGMRLFIRKAHCSNCHLVDGFSAPFTDGAFHNTGVEDGRRRGRDRGRAGVTNDPADEGAFKTPSLRGVALRPFLMHDGSITSLRQAIEAYNVLDPARRPGIDDRLKPLFLSPSEIEAIVAFLGTLTPEKEDKNERYP